MAAPDFECPFYEDEQRIEVTTGSLRGTARVVSNKIDLTKPCLLQQIGSDKSRLLYVSGGVQCDRCGKTISMDLEKR